MRAAPALRCFLATSCSNSPRTPPVPLLMSPPFPHSTSWAHPLIICVPDPQELTALASSAELAAPRGTPCNRSAGPLAAASARLGRLWRWRGRQRSSGRLFRRAIRRRRRRRRSLGHRSALLLRRGVPAVAGADSRREEAAATGGGGGRVRAELVGAAHIEEPSL